MNMPKVTQCSAEQCAYNTGEICHALAITVGDTTHPMCDTFCPSSMQGGDVSSTAGVGACKTSECLYNVSLECQAPSIQVGCVGEEVDCLTYDAK